MYNTLESIEQNYGCVAEYNRCMAEREMYDSNEMYLDDEISYEIEKEPRKFAIGNVYRQVGVFGGVTYYKIKSIDRENNKVTCSQTWEDLDGSGTRPDETFDLIIDEDGNEKFLEWVSENYGTFYVFA